MWLTCIQCERRLLCLDRVAPSPYRCPACRERHPDWRPRFRPALEQAGRVVRAGDLVDPSAADVVIDVTPAGD